MIRNTILRLQRGWSKLIRILSMTIAIRSDAGVLAVSEEYKKTAWKVIT